MTDPTQFRGHITPSSPTANPFAGLETLIEHGDFFDAVEHLVTKRQTHPSNSNFFNALKQIFPSLATAMPETFRKHQDPLSELQPELQDTIRFCPDEFTRFYQLAKAFIFSSNTTEVTLDKKAELTLSPYIFFRELYELAKRNHSLVILPIIFETRDPLGQSPHSGKSLIELLNSISNKTIPLDHKMEFFCLALDIFPKLDIETQAIVTTELATLLYPKNSEGLIASTLEQKDTLDALGNLNRLLEHPNLPECIAVGVTACFTRQLQQRLNTEKNPKRRGDLYYTAHATGITLQQANSIATKASKGATSSEKPPAPNDPLGVENTIDHDGFASLITNALCSVDLEHATAQAFTTYQSTHQTDFARESKYIPSFFYSGHNKNGLRAAQKHQKAINELFNSADAPSTDLINPESGLATQHCAAVFATLYHLQHEKGGFKPDSSKTMLLASITGIGCNKISTLMVNSSTREKVLEYAHDALLAKVRHELVAFQRRHSNDRESASPHRRNSHATPPFNVDNRVQCIDKAFFTSANPSISSHQTDDQVLCGR